jgi:hypothetical protein
MESKMNQKNYLNIILFSQLTNWSAYTLLGKNLLYTQKYPLVKIANLLERNKTQVSIQNGVTYKRPTIKINGNGIFLRDEVDGIEIGTKKQFLIKKGQFLLSKIDARNGAFGVVPDELDNGIITGNFWTFDVDYTKVNPHYLSLLMGTKYFQNLSQTASVGTTNRNYLQEELFLNFEIPLPSLVDQNHIIDTYNQKIEAAKQLEKEAEEIEKNIENSLYKILGIEKRTISVKTKGLQFSNFYSIKEWGFDKIISRSRSINSTSKNLNIAEFAVEAFRGKSPKYKNDSHYFILNQKCNR